ncbi:MAG TPA: glycosyltransferase, partial [Candidatus Udaeobacter sp.]|nr:glycosyltransferase [Candidatus Udaeobacter sp.]
LAPRRGLGLSPSAEAVAEARARHPDLEFTAAELEGFDLGGETFDFIVVWAALGEARDVQAMLDRVRKASRPDTRIVLAHPNSVWEPLLRLVTRIQIGRRAGELNWLSLQDLENLCRLADFEVVRKSGEVIFPFPIPGLAWVANRLLARMWPFTQLGLIQLVVTRPIGPPPPALARPRVSVIIPARNERGNIAAAIQRTPEMEAGTEIVFVEGNSRDGTAEEIERQIALHPERNLKLVAQGSGIGKGDAVRKGFAAATGDILIILDADLTVPPELLPRFIAVLVSGKGELVSGTRLVYPMEDDAMRFLNKLGNRFFSFAFSWLLDQPIRDTLCGTKGLSRAHYDFIASQRSYFGDFDPFGDFDLLLGAAKANMKIVEVPVRYAARSYGTTNISRFKHGWLLLQMSWFAWLRLKLR